MGCHFFLQGIFLTQGSNPHLLNLLHWKVYSLPLHHLGSPYTVCVGVCVCVCVCVWASQVAQTVNLPAMWGTWV